MGVDQFSGTVYADVSPIKIKGSSIQRRLTGQRVAEYLAGIDSLDAIKGVQLFKGPSILVLVISVR